ncbi:MAG: hypothetical protein PHI97_30790 [Desulfobulbus sp.]|nr:hypothetical protein [Desulfobulbus sp.]
MKLNIFFKKLFDLLGDPQEFTLENRIFNGIMFFFSATGLATVVYDTILNEYFGLIIISISCFIVPGSCYIYSLKTKNYKHLIVPVNIYFFLALSIGLFFLNGFSGSLPYFFFLLITYGVVFLKNPFKFHVPFVLLLLISLILLEYFNPVLFKEYASRSQKFIDIGISLSLCIIINSIIFFFVLKEYSREKKLKEIALVEAIRDKEVIREAFDEIKILKGLLPICSNCKKIKDDTGSWNQLETYIHKHSEAQFSHGICPDCAHELYPEYAHKFSVTSLKCE